MNQKILLAIGIAGPMGLLAAAFWFQYIGGLYPCPLCIWQRWPHVAVVAFGLAYLVFNFQLLPFCSAMVSAAGAAIATFHTGVEYGWWEGLANCTGAGINTLSSEEMLDFSTPVQLASCDVPAWVFLGFSMATWNGIFSVLLCLTWLMAAVRHRVRKAN